MILKNFIRSKSKAYLLKIICLFGATSLFADGELAQAELKVQLEQTDQRAADIRFRLYKELLTLQLKSYRASEKDLKALASQFRIASTEEQQRQKIIEGFNLEEKEIFASYDALLDLAYQLTNDAATYHRTFHLLASFDVKAIHEEPFQLYFLQILELEENLDFSVHDAALWVREQAATLTGILQRLEKEIIAMEISGKIAHRTDLTFKHKEFKFYWTTMVNLCHEFLSRLDSRWSQCDYNRLKILNLVRS